MSLDQTIYDVAIRNGFSPATSKLIVAQARLESANYSSNVFKQNNNLFGMKYVGQPLATKGTPAPQSERSSTDKITNYYAKYNTPEDSVRDVVERLYSKTIGGVTQMQLQNAMTPEDFAEYLKKRGYFGVSASQYAKGLKSRLLSVRINEIVSDIKNTAMNNKDIIEVAIVMVILASAYLLLNR
jgi:flagellum-specific peptidoglycan hydrolase FlgJ